MSYLNKIYDVWFPSHSFLDDERIFRREQGLVGVSLHDQTMHPSSSLELTVFHGVCDFSSPPDFVVHPHGEDCTCHIPLYRIEMDSRKGQGWLKFERDDNVSEFYPTKRSASGKSTLVVVEESARAAGSALVPRHYRDAREKFKELMEYTSKNLGRKAFGQLSRVGDPMN